MAIIADGPDAVNLFRLIALRSAVKLESHGLKSRGGSKRRMAAIELGMRPNAKHADVIHGIEASIATMRAAGVGFTNTDREVNG